MKNTLAQTFRSFLKGPKKTPEEKKDKDAESGIDKYGLTAIERSILMRQNLADLGLTGDDSSGCVVGLVQNCSGLMLFFLYVAGQHFDRHIDGVVSIVSICAGTMTMVKGGRCSCVVAMSKFATVLSILGLFGKSLYVPFHDAMPELPSDEQAVFWLSLIFHVVNAIVNIGTVYCNMTDSRENNNEEKNDEEYAKQKEEEAKIMKVIEEKIQRYVESQKKTKAGKGKKKQAHDKAKDVEVNIHATSAGQAKNEDEKQQNDEDIKVNVYVINTEQIKDEDGKKQKTGDQEKDLTGEVQNLTPDSENENIKYEIAKET